MAHVALPKADEPSPLPAPVSVTPHAYRVGETLDTMSLFSMTSTPSGESAQVGLGGSDLLGRLNWQVLAGLGNGAGPRGAMAGAAWRGWLWAPSFHAFSILERPSSQRFLPLPGLDQERRGVELALTREGLGRPRFSFRPYVATERVSLDDRAEVSRTLVGGEARLAESWGLDDQALRLDLTTKEQWGHTDGQAWRLTRVSLGAAWSNPWIPLGVHFEQGQISGAPSVLDRFHLGGTTTSLLPTALDANRVEQVALPAHTASGNRLQRLRAKAGAQGIVAYAERSSVWQDAAPKPAAQRVVGLELSSRNMGLPLDILRRLPGNLSFTLGVHRPLDGIMKGRTVGTVSLLLRP